MNRDLSRGILLFFTFFFLFLSLLLLFRLHDMQKFTRQESDHAIQTIQSVGVQSSLFWMRRFSDFGIQHLKDDSSREIDINASKNLVLIVFSDRVSEGCRECLGLEATDWQNAILSSSLPVERVIVAGKVKSKPKLRQELSAMGYNGHLVFDDAGEMYQKLNLSWSPAVFLLRQGYVVFEYTGDMNDREKTTEIINRYINFLTLRDE
ncbi:MAG: hypothetical protein RMI34_10825 [Chloroherpetonaceae bacterium]|nr:hypothetical protein [Chloroherpetonaceae bacterium]